MVGWVRRSKLNLRTSFFPKRFEPFDRYGIITKYAHFASVAKLVLRFALHDISEHWNMKYVTLDLMIITPPVKTRLTTEIHPPLWMWPFLAVGHVLKSGTKFLKIFFTHVPTSWRHVRHICPSSAKSICYSSVCHWVFSQGSTSSAHNNRGGGGAPLLLCAEEVEP